MGPRFKNIILKTGEALDRTHDRCLTRRVALPLHHGGFLSLVVLTEMADIPQTA